MPRRTSPPGCTSTSTEHLKTPKAAQMRSHLRRLRRLCGCWGQWKESPQAQEPPALGLSMVKPCFSMVSEKSMVAPSR